MSSKDNQAKGTPEGEEQEPSVVNPWASLILLGGMAAIILSGLFTDAGKLSGEWGSLLDAINGKGKQAPASEGEATATGRVLRWNSSVIGAIGSLEDRFDLESPFCQLVQPRMQGVLARLGEGSEEVLIGDDGWLFYRPSFAHLTAKTKVGLTGDERGYDAAYEAVTGFARYLDSRGIKLVLMPVPPKLAVHPERFTSSDSSEIIVSKADQRWAERIEAAGVRVFRTSAALREFQSQFDSPAYLQTDTHWRPESMEWCARKLSEYLVAEGLIDPGSLLPEGILKESTIAAKGDLWRMLRLHEDSSLFPPEEVPLKQVGSSSGMKWRPDRASEVLLMGDSFCNIYSLGQMGWGEGAGFAEHLGHSLRKPLDVVLRNSDGAHATRKIIAQDLARGRDRLQGKKVVVWEFAARELTQGRWIEMEYQLGEKPESLFVEVVDDQVLEVEGTLVEISRIPIPGSVPYQDFVATIHLSGLTAAGVGDAGGTEALAYVRAMQGNKWLPTARLRPGQRVLVTLGSWQEAEADFGRWNRSEASEDLLLEPVNWAREIRLVSEEDESP